MSSTVIGWLFGGWSFDRNIGEHVPSVDGSRRRGSPSAVKNDSSNDASTVGQDAELMARIAESDDVAFTQLMHRYASQLYRVAALRTNNEFDAAEVVQDVFVALWHGRTSRQVQGDIRGYLFRSVYNRASNARRSQRAQQRLRANIVGAGMIAERASENEGETSVLEQELRQIVRTVLSTLPPRTSEIYLLGHEHGLMPAEIAAVLGIGVPTVHNQLSRARQAIIAAVHEWRRAGA